MRTNIDFRLPGSTAGRNAVIGVILVLAAAGGGCAVPRPAGPGPAVVQTPAGIPPLPPADTIPSYPLVKDTPSIVSATRSLEAAAEQARPPHLLGRAREAIAAAQMIRCPQGDPVILPNWGEDHARFLAFYDLAYRDLEEVVVRYPGQPEAPEARYLLGLMHDYPHLDLFEDALAQYRLAVERHPGSPWAQKAAERIAVIEAILCTPSGSH